MKKFKLEIDITNIEIKNGKLVIELDDDENNTINKDIENHPKISDLNRFIGSYLLSKATDELFEKIVLKLNLKEL